MIEKLVRQCKIMTGEHNSNKSILISIEPSQQHLTIDRYLIQEPCRSQSMSVGQGPKAVSKCSLTRTRKERRGHRGTHVFWGPTLSRSFRIHAPQKIFTHCCRASSPIELRKSAASLPRSRILAAIVVGVVLQWQCRRRCAATCGDDEKG
jgi:hypothetical protein